MERKRLERGCGGGIEIGLGGNISAKGSHQPNCKYKGADRREKRWVRLIQTTSTVVRPNNAPASEAAKMVRIVSFMPRKAPTMAISFTSPKPIPCAPRQRR